MTKENFSAIYNESLTQLIGNSENAYAALLSLCVAASRLACFENDNIPLKQVWNLPASAKVWQNKARLLLCYLVGGGIPQTSKAGKVAYIVSRESVRITQKGEVFIADKAKENHASAVRKHDLKGSRTADKAMDLISALRWQKAEKPETLLNSQQVADLLEGLRVDEICAAKLAGIIESLRAE